MTNFNRVFPRALALLLLVLFTAPVLSADWPQFRYDANRSAASPESLLAKLHLQWVREMPAPQPAFPGEIRLRYDATYEPVVMGGTMFVPSMVTDSVTALDTKTGKQRWRFTTDGPVRFAPVAAGGKVYFVSDDGHLYCVGAEDGKLLWRFRGLPKGKKDRKLIGDGRLVSLFPARGGPVLHDGIVYFGAGIWAGEGVFVHALDAKTGKVRWSNTDSDHIKNANMDHGVSYYAGLTPQGYLTVVDGKLIVPCGRQLPAVLDLDTGKLKPYTIGWGGRNGLPKGAWFVTGVGKYLIHGGDLYNIERPNDERLRDSRGRSDFKHMLYLGGLTRLQIDRTNQKGLGDFRTPVMTPTAMYCRDGGIAAYDLTEVKVEERAKSPISNYRKNDKYPDKLRAVFGELWKLPSKSRVHIKAGRRLYCGRAGAVEAIDIPKKGGKPEITWQTEIEGTPQSMVAADGKLFVMTREGRIYAFGEKQRGEPVTHALPKGTPPKADEWTKKAADFLKGSGTTDGYILVLGVGTGRLAEELVRQSRCDVIAIDPDAAKVASLRQSLHKKGLYGSRIAVHTGNPRSYPFPPYVANLIVTEDPSVVGKWDEALTEKLEYCLRPYGGAACIDVPAEHRKEFKKETGMDYSLLVRAGPLPRSGDWSHEDANAANTGAAQDLFLEAPLTRLWFDGSFRWPRQHGQVVVRVAGGRVLLRGRELRAIDVYTGRLLWTACVRDSREMVALEDAIYLADGPSLVVLDPANGKQVDRINLPAGVRGPLANLRVAGDRLLGSTGKLLVCVNRQNGKLIWKSEREKNIGCVALGGGKVFCADLFVKRRGQPDPKDLTTVAIDLATGKKLWQIDGGSEVRYNEPLDLVVTSRGVFRGKDGTRVWTGGGAGRVTADKLLSGNADGFTIFDLKTGKKSSGPQKWNRRGCTSLKASSNLLTTRFQGNAAYIDLATGKITSIWNVRAACCNNLYPANGVLNIPGMTGGCTCNYIPVSQAFVPSSVMERGGAE